MPSRWFSQRIPSSYWPIDDIIPLPAEDPASSWWVIQSATFLPRHFFRACIIHLDLGYSGLHSSYSSWRVNNSSSQNTCTPNTLYTPVHTSKVGVHEGHLTSICVHIQLLRPLTCVYSTNFEFLFKMADWTFKDALTAIQSLPSIPTSILQSTGGLRLGDIHFTKIQTTLQMRTVPIVVLEKWAEGGSFNLECMAEGHYSHTTAILILLNPNAEGTALESKCWAYCLMMHGTSGVISAPSRSSSSMLIPWWGWNGNPPILCIGQSAHSWVTMADTWPSPQTLCSAQLIPCLLFTRMIPLRWPSGVSRIILFPPLQMVYWFVIYSHWDCPQHEYAMDRCHWHLLIPRGVHFLPDLFPLDCCSSQSHATPYHDPKTGEDAPFVTVGPFTWVWTHCSMVQLEI